MPRTKKYASNAERQAAYRLRCLQTQALLGSPENAAGSSAASGNSVKADYRRWNRLIQAAGRDLESVGQEMTDYFEARSESWQEDQRGEEFSELMETQEEAQNLLQDLIQALTLRSSTPGRKPTGPQQQTQNGVGGDGAGGDGKD